MTDTTTEKTTAYHHPLVGGFDAALKAFAAATEPPAAPSANTDIDGAPSPPSQEPSPSPPKLVRGENHYPTITVTRAELATLASHPRQSFRTFLESKGIVHKRGLMVESWTEDKEGERAFLERDGVTFKQHDVLYFRNFRPKTDAQIAKEDGGAGKVGLMR